MPIYEYKCDSCGRIFEVLQGFGEAPVKTCKFCGKKVHKIISPAGFILKGPGFYVNDYPSKDREKALRSENNNSGHTSRSKTSSSSDTKQTKEKEKSKDTTSAA